jgi:chloramphenicol 3-O-phosphotransferase
MDLRRRNLCLVADSFAESGFVPVIDDVVVRPATLELYVSRLRTRPLRLVQLVPRLEVLERRDAGRDEQVFSLWRHLNEELHERMPRVGLWLDASDMTAEETVDAVLNRFDEALLAD